MTQTFFLTNTTFANGTHTADVEDSISNSVSSGTNTATVNSPENSFAFLWTGDANVPNNATWPTGNYRCQINMTKVPSGTSYGFRTINAQDGHLARWNSGSGDLDTWAQTEAAFTGTGVKLATTGSVTPGSAAAGDRAEALLAVDRPSGQHGSASMDITYASDTWFEGPWTSGVAVPIFMHHINHNNMS